MANTISPVKGMERDARFEGALPITTRKKWLVAGSEIQLVVLVAVAVIVVVRVVQAGEFNSALPCT